MSDFLERLIKEAPEMKWEHRAPVPYKPRPYDIQQTTIETYMHNIEYAVQLQVLTNTLGKEILCREFVLWIGRIDDVETTYYTAWYDDKGTFKGIGESKIEELHKIIEAKISQKLLT